MKKALSTAVLFIGFLPFAQSFEQTAAEKSCECLKKFSDLTDEKYQNCISTSLTEALVMGDVKKNMEQIGTVTGMEAALLKIDAILNDICIIDQSSELEQKRKMHYGYSKNTETTNSYKIGKDFMEQEKYKLAIQAFEKALKKDGNFVLALDDIAASHRRLEKFEEAIKYYKRSLAIFPEGDFALMNIGVLYNMKKDYKTANHYYEKLIRFQPNNAEGFYGLGRNYYYLEDYENAMINMIKAHKIYVADKDEYAKDSEQMLGIIYQDMKEKGKERDFIRIATENGVDIGQ